MSNEHTPADAPSLREDKPRRCEGPFTIDLEYRVPHYLVAYWACDITCAQCGATHHWTRGSLRRSEVRHARRLAKRHTKGKHWSGGAPWSEQIEFRP